MSPLFPNIQSKLDLNGPVLSFDTQPVGTSCSVASGIATFIGIATATFPDTQTGRDTNTGTVTYQWYKGSTAITDGTGVTGSATTTLTLSGLTSPDDDSSEFFVQVGYDPNGLTPNAINEPINSDSATVSVFPTISISTQPEDSTVVEDISTTFSVVATNSDPLFATDEQTRPAPLQYQWYLNGANLSNDFESLFHGFSGEKSPTLTIRRFEPGLDRVYCSVSHANAQPGIVTSTEAKLDVAADRTFLKWELIGNGTRQEKGERDLDTAGPFRARARAQVDSRIIQMFSPERDIDVKITLGGAAGAPRNGRRGGEGGISVLKMTMKKNVEYTVRLGIHSNLGAAPAGGANGGGGAAAIYEKAKLLAVCGGGGGAGLSNRGGDGGGCNVVGEKGLGGAGGKGGEYTPVDQLPINGQSAVGGANGIISGCTIGNYWKDQGKLPCDDVGTGVALLDDDGNVLSDTTSTNTGDIIRGFKSGQAHLNNGGAGIGSKGGGGGAGAVGGDGGNFQGGGGGASGYYSSQVELLDSSTLSGGTRLGGNDDVAFICVESYVKDGDQRPCIPPNSGQMIEEKTVTWSVSRSAGDSNTVTFSKQSGDGPSAITFGPNGGSVTTQISAGAVYTRTSSTASGGRGLSFRLSGNTLQLDDNLDSDFNDLQVTPNFGQFTSDSRWVANW